MPPRRTADKLIPMSEGVKILYKGAIDNITFLKRQQWIITNYSLIVYAAVFALARNANTVEKTLLTIIAGCAFIYAVYCMVHTQLTMTRLRKSLFYIYHTHFTDKEREAFTLWKTEPTFTYTPGFIFGLILANTVAVAATVYLVWRAIPAIFESATRSVGGF